MSIIPVDALPRHLLSSVFQVGNVPTTALQADPRVSYAAYIPDQHYAPAGESADKRRKIPLLVSVHGTSRTHIRHIAAWRSFADSQRCAILAPLFPAMVQGPLDLNGYHYLGMPPTDNGKLIEKALKAQIRLQPLPGATQSDAKIPIRYDLCLLAMLDEVALRWPGIDTSRVFLSGFSGGAQFVHNFLYLHAERVIAAAVGSPGSVTPLDESKAWPLGVKDLQSVFGKELDLEKLRDVFILGAVGGADLWGKGVQDRNAIKGSVPGPTRVQNMQGLVRSWRGAGLKIEERIVPGAGHVMEEVHPVIEEFMAPHVIAWWAMDAAR